MHDILPHATTQGHTPNHYHGLQLTHTDATVFSSHFGPAVSTGLALPGDMFRFTKVENKTGTVAQDKTAISEVQGFDAMVVHFYNSR